MADKLTPGPDFGLLNAPVSKASSDRLESWKEIAAYLNRTLRTVQRWEKSEGLPVHRHQHEERASVFAYKAELDVWWQNGHSGLREVEEAVAGEREQNEPEKQASDEIRPAAGLSPSAARLRQLLWMGVAAAMVTLAALAAVRFRPRSRLNFQPRDWVLMTSFENRTGQPLLDGTLEYALERELSNSQFVNVASRERIEDTLRLMRKPLDTKIDAALGREICLRDGGIRALLTGRVEKLGSTYVLSVELVDPVRGITVASMSEEDPAETRLAATVRRLSDRVRETLGEKARLIQQSDQRLEKVTTPSLHALQLYTQANALVAGVDDAAAAELLERALADDPNFASAHLLLGYAYSNLGSIEKALPHFRRAYQLADSTSERERLFILATYYDEVLNDQQKSVEAYETLLRLYPDHLWALGNLMIVYAAHDRREDGDRLAVRLAGLRPNDLFVNADAAYYLAVDQKSPALAAPYLKRAATIVPRDGDRLGTSKISLWVRLFPATQAWLNDDVEGAQAELTRVENATFWRDDKVYPYGVGFFYIALGQVKAASRYFEEISDPAERNAALAQLAFFRDDAPALREHLQYFRQHPEPSLWTALAVAMMIRGGYVADAEKMARLYARPEEGGPFWSDIAFARGQHAKGIHLGEEDIAMSYRHPTNFLAAESLARQYQHQGDLRSAVRVLERMSQGRRTVCRPDYATGYGVYWMRTQFQLAQVYRELGRVQDAQRVEDQLRKLLTYADPDFPMLVELHRVQQADATARNAR